jgi:hypothetical protein
MRRRSKETASTIRHQSSYLIVNLENLFHPLSTRVYVNLLEGISYIQKAVGYAALLQDLRDLMEQYGTRSPGRICCVRQGGENHMAFIWVPGLVNIQKTMENHHFSWVTMEIHDF